jgi:hypothetical protein
MYPRIISTLLIAGCILFWSEPKLFAQWQSVADGAELLRQPLHGGIAMTYLRVSLDKFNVRVATPRIPKFGVTSKDAFNPERGARGLFLDDYLARYKGLAAISAGYVVTFSPPTPLGQIKSDGVVIGTPHSSWATEGTFCSDKGQASIETSTDPLSKSKYRDCLQVGPVLLLEGAVPSGLLSSANGSDYDKMVRGQVPQAMVCIDSSGRVLLGLTAKSGVTLSEFVIALQHDPINCLNALRLQPGGMMVGPELYGSDVYLHPSALLVLK